MKISLERKYRITTKNGLYRVEERLINIRTGAVHTDWSSCNFVEYDNLESARSDLAERLQLNKKADTPWVEVF